jgi:hypothetical protein
MVKVAMIGLDTAEIQQKLPYVTEEVIDALRG